MRKIETKPFMVTGGEPVRLFDARLMAGPAPAEAPGTLLGLAEGRLLVAASGGRLAIGKLRVGSGAKLAAAEAVGAAGLEAGERLR